MIPLGWPFAAALVIAVIVWHPYVAVVMVGILAFSFPAAFVVGAFITEGSEPGRTVLARVYGGGTRH